MIFFFWRLTCGSQENAGPDLNRLVNLNRFDANAWNITLGFHPLKAQQCFEGNQIWFCFPYYNLLLGNIRNYFTVTSDCLISTLNTFLGVLNFIISPSTLMVKHFPSVACWEASILGSEECSRSTGELQVLPQWECFTYVAFIWLPIPQASLQLSLLPFCFLHLLVKD